MELEILGLLRLTSKGLPTRHHLKFLSREESESFYFCGWNLNGIFSLSSCPAGMPDPLEDLSWKSFGEFCTDTCLPVAVQWKVGRALDPSAWFLQETSSLFLFSCSVSYNGITYAATEVSLVKPIANMEWRMLYIKWVYCTYHKLFTCMGPLSPSRTNCVSMFTVFHKFPASLVTTMWWDPLKYFFNLSNHEKATLPSELNLGLWWLTVRRAGFYL